MYGLRVVLAEYDPGLRKQIKDILLQAGCIIIGEVCDGRNALQLVFNAQPDLLIISSQLPGRSGLEVARIIAEQRVAPVLMLLESEEQMVVRELVEHWLIAYLWKPVDENNFYPVLEIYLQMYKKVCRLEEENRKLTQSIEARKILERAKGLLIDHQGLSEQQAYKYLQKLSMDKCVPIYQVAKLVIKSMASKLKEGGIK